MAINIRSLYSDSLVKTSSLLFIASMVTNVSNYVFQIVMGRLLTPPEYGLMNALLALLMIMSVPIATLLMVVTRKTAEYKATNNYSGISGLYRNVNFRILLSGVVGLMIYILCAPYIQHYINAPSVMPVIILGLSIFTALAYPINTAVLQGVQDYKWLGINQGMGGPAKFFFCVMFVLAGFSVNGVMAGLVVSGLLMWLLSYIPIRKYIQRDMITSSFADHISFSQVFPVFLANLAFAILTQIDIVLVSRYFSAHDAGIYASAAILGKAVMYIPGAIVLAMFPMVSEQSALNQSSRHLLVKSLTITLCISGFGTLLFYFFPALIISITYGSQYSEAHNVLKYYSVAMLPMSLLMVLMNYLIAKGRSLISYIIACGAIVETIVLIIFHSSLEVFVMDILAIGLLVLCISLILLIIQARSTRLIVR